MMLYFSSLNKFDWLEWHIEKKPNNSEPLLSVEFKYARFTPDLPGEYNVVVESFSNNLELIERRTFFYDVLGLPINIKNQFFNNKISNADSLNNQELDVNKISNLDSIINEVIDTNIVEYGHLKTEDDLDSLFLLKEISMVTEKKVNAAENDAFTIQVFSIPDKKIALGKLNYLSRNGFSGNVTEFVHPTSNTIWYDNVFW